MNPDPDPPARSTADSARGGFLRVALAVLILAPSRALAVLDIKDNGPTLSAGGFAMRVTNAGIVGNAFFDVGLSSDPSFEFPDHSGQEVLNHAALWVGAIDRTGEARVSGGPLLEWRPSPAADDVVRIARHGRLGTLRLVDDDNDGRVDEEILNGRDDDGDGEVDEDLGFEAQQMLAADYSDDRPEAAHVVSEGESHRALGLVVHQEAYAWSVQGYDGIAGLQFRITNRGEQTLRQLYVGLLADLDARRRNERTGHLDDRVVWMDFSRSINQGVSVITLGSGGDISAACVQRLDRRLPVLKDGHRPDLPVATVLPLDHTIDPLALIDPGKAYARAPGSVSFRSVVFSRSGIPEDGGLPLVDRQRYAAMAGELSGARHDIDGDHVVLVSCGPFATLAPGESIEFAAALVAAESLDSLATAVENALYLHNGTRVNLLPDSTGPVPRAWHEGRSGINGHEACVAPPGGRTFQWDPHCPDKFPSEARPPSREVIYGLGECIWTDADCSACTGLNGNETVLRWLDPGAVPPSPGMRVTPLDRAVRIDWDNVPEILIRAGVAARPGARFQGYRVYKLADWRGRESRLPPRENWSLLAAFGPDQFIGEIPLSAITDTTLDYVRILYRQKQYPVGRYSTIDTEVHNGFEYVYAVTTVGDVGLLPSGRPGPIIESPLVATFDGRVSPQAAARPDARSVWVVPNPFRAREVWDRPAVLGDGLTRHIDFMGLPRARCTIKIWTVAGDLVAQLDHDGRAGGGEASWDLVSRNGQDVESGLYMFTVESSFGTQVGRFVVIR